MNPLAATEVILEQLTDDMAEVTVLRWYREEGDAVDEGVELAEVTSEEGTFKIAAPCTGVLRQVYFSEGESVSVGDILCEIEEE